MISLWYELISIYTLKNQWITIVSKIWFRMSTTNIHLLPFSHLQKRGLECRYTVRTYRLPKKNCLKFPTLKFGILPFSHANTLARLPSWVPWWNYHIRFKMVHSNTKNPKSTIRQISSVLLTHNPLLCP